MVYTNWVILKEIKMMRYFKLREHDTLKLTYLRDLEKWLTALHGENDSEKQNTGKEIYLNVCFNNWN